MSPTRRVGSFWRILFSALSLGCACIKNKRSRRSLLMFKLTLSQWRHACRTNQATLWLTGWRCCPDKKGVEKRGEAKPDKNQRFCARFWRQRLLSSTFRIFFVFQNGNYFLKKNRTGIKSISIVLSRIDSSFLVVWFCSKKHFFRKERKRRKNENDNCQAVFVISGGI